jgi:hypothetical protein
MIYNHPVLAILDKHNTVSSWKGLGFSVFSISEGIITRIDSGVAIDPD